jgi:probable addiction module antidote protein
MEPGKVTHRPFDTAKYLADPAAQAAYLSDALQSGSKELILRAFSTIARARGMTALARETGVGRETLYAAFGDGGNPTLETLLAVTNALDIELQARVGVKTARAPELAD